MNLADLISVNALASERSDLTRFLSAINSAQSFRVSMKVGTAPDVSCSLPVAVLADLQTILQARVVAIDTALVDLGVTP